MPASSFDTFNYIMESLPTLLQSRRMSHGILLLQRETANTHTLPSTALTGEAADRGDWGQQQPQFIENAVRVASLLVYSFTSFLSKCVSDPGGSVVRQLAALQLDDFFISLQQNGTFSSAADALDGYDGRFQHNMYYTILGVDVISPGKMNNGANDQRMYQQDQVCLSEPTPKQILGRLLYSLFDPGDSALLSNLIRAAEVDQTIELSLFSRLVESKAIPVSICRMLADMIDISQDDKAHSPYASFEEVLEDLEKMITDPKTFLHDDPYFPLGEMGQHSQGQEIPQAPVFGLVQHGQDKELQTLMNLVVDLEDSQDATKSPKSGVEVVLVSGMQGSGKSTLVNSIGEHLTDLGWVVTNSTFDNGTAYPSSISSLSKMFDGVISNLVTMKEGGIQADIEYIKRVSKSILEEVGQDDLSRLTFFLPSLHMLYSDTMNLYPSSQLTYTDQLGLNSMQLVLFLSKILEAVLEPERFINICCDQLQLADEASVSFISQVLANIGSIKDICRHLFFIGMCQTQEAGADPFAFQDCHLRTNANINLTEIKLSSLSKKDIEELLMAELRLPRRMVLELAHEVHRRTTGNAMCVMELLNSLVSDSIIAYSPEKLCFSWDPIRIDLLPIGDKAAEMIASSVKFLPPDSQQILQILSCFGPQTDIPMLQKLDLGYKPQEGIVASLDKFVESGILDRAGPVIRFNHDLILKAVCQSMPLDQRLALHLDIGTFLRSSSSANGHKSMAAYISQLHQTSQDVFAGSSLQFSLPVPSYTPSEISTTPSFYAQESKSEISSDASISSTRRQVFQGPGHPLPSQESESDSAAKMESIPENAAVSAVPQMQKVASEPVIPLPSHVTTAGSEHHMTMLVRVLFHYLERKKDKAALAAAKKALEECKCEHPDEVHERLLHERIRKVVSEEHWAQARLIHRQLVSNHQKKRDVLVSHPQGPNKEHHVNGGPISNSSNMEVEADVKPRKSPSTKSNEASGAESKQATSLGSVAAAGKSGTESPNTSHDPGKVQKLVELLEKQPDPGDQQDMTSWMLNLMNVAESQKGTSTASAPSSTPATTEVKDGPNPRRGRPRVKKRKKSPSPEKEIHQGSPPSSPTRSQVRCR